MQYKPKQNNELDSAPLAFLYFMISTVGHVSCLLINFIFELFRSKEKCADVAINSIGSIIIEENNE